MRRALALAAVLGIAALPQLAPAQPAAPPACFAAALPALRPVEEGNPNPACQTLALVLKTAAAPDIRWLPGQLVNAILDLTEGGFATNTFVLEFHVTPAFSQAFITGDDELVRFADSSLSARVGTWWVPKRFVTDAAGRFKSSEEIKDVLALPAESNPTLVAYSTKIVVGTFGYVGIAAPAFNRPGGSIQFWFPAEPIYTKDTVPASP